MVPLSGTLRRQRMDAVDRTVRRLEHLARHPDGVGGSPSAPPSATGERR